MTTQGFGNFELNLQELNINRLEDVEFQLGKLNFQAPANGGSWINRWRYIGLNGIHLHPEIQTDNVGFRLVSNA